MNNREAGVDEAGRGPLAGPVVAAAVILDPDRPIQGLRDSKQLTERVRERLAEEIRRCALSYAVGQATVAEIDRWNILQASLLAMKRAIEALSVVPTHIYVDGLFCPSVRGVVQAVVRGDQRFPAISAASILAKVTRDRQMLILDRQYPQYGFRAHKGYPTPAHLEALRVCGPSVIHRRSFRPVRDCLLSERERPTDGNR